MWATRVVFRCFKCMERTADRITGAAGPFFIAIAIALISCGIFAFFEIIAPTLRWRWLSTPICALIAFNTFAHYYWAITIPPGFADEDVRLSGTRSSKVVESRWMAPIRKQHFKSGGVSWTYNEPLIPAATTKCAKCASNKPDDMQEMCPKVRPSLPRINQCVGIGNERHFILFMAYVITCALCFISLGYPAALQVFKFLGEWDYYTPKVMFLLIYIISIALGIAVGAMLSWHLYLVIKSQTTVENHDAKHYRKVAKSRGEPFVNSFDLGAKQNLLLFFNITPTGHPWWVLLTPFRTKPYTDGYSWRRRVGFEQGHGGIRGGEELTDEEDDD